MAMVACVACCSASIAVHQLNSRKQEGCGGVCPPCLAVAPAHKQPCQLPRTAPSSSPGLRPRVQAAPNEQALRAVCSRQVLAGPRCWQHHQAPPAPAPAQPAPSPAPAGAAHRRSAGLAQLLPPAPRTNARRQPRIPSASSACRTAPPQPPCMLLRACQPSLHAALHRRRPAHARAAGIAAAARACARAGSLARRTQGGRRGAAAGAGVPDLRRAAPRTSRRCIQRARAGTARPMRARRRRGCQITATTRAAATATACLPVGGA